MQRALPTKRKLVEFTRLLDRLCANPRYLV